MTATRIPGTWCFLLTTVILTAVFLADLAYAQAPYTPKEGTEGVTVPGVGRLPREIIWNVDGSEMILVPGGEYRIGIDNPEAKGFSKSEGPEVTVTIGPFYIDKYEITHEQYMRVVEDAGLGMPRGVRYMSEAEKDLPIRGISYDDAAGYARFVHKVLPTEAEWEIAARGPQGHLYPWGDEKLEKAAALGEGSAGKPRRGGSSPLDKSGFGIMDMAGNVSEWVRDNYVREYYEQVAGDVFPLIDDNGTARTIRGGNFYSESDGRATLRFAGVMTQTRDEVGFRTVYYVRPPATPTPSPTPGPPTPTPTPTAEDILSMMSDELLPFFKNPPEAPEALLAQASAGSRTPVLNETPHELTIAFLDPYERKLYHFPTVLRPGEFTTLQVPRIDFPLMVAYAKDSKIDGLVNLGFVSGESKSLLLLPVNLFSPVARMAGDDLETDSAQKATQLYGRFYSPRSHEFLIHNSTDLPAEVVVAPEGSSKEMSWVIEAGESILANQYRPQDLTLRAFYVGTKEEDKSDASNLVTFVNDDRFDQRIFLLTVNEVSTERVTVVTSRRAPILIEEIRARIPGGYRASFVERE